MELTKPKVLLMGVNTQGFSYLMKRLQGHGCDCEFAGSYSQARLLLMNRIFDLVLTPMRLREESTFPLLALLSGSETNLFYSSSVEDSCWWLPAIRNGQSCFGAGALRPSEFVIVLDQTIAEIQFRHLLERTKRRVEAAPPVALQERPPEAEPKPATHLEPRRKAG
jgi:hypothetical protein